MNDLAGPFAAGAILGLVFGWYWHKVWHGWVLEERYRRWWQKKSDDLDALMAEFMRLCKKEGMELKDYERHNALREQLEAEASRIREGRLFSYRSPDLVADLGVMADELGHLDLHDQVVIAAVPAGNGSWDILVAREGSMPDGLVEGRVVEVRGP